MQGGISKEIITSNYRTLNSMSPGYIFYDMTSISIVGWMNPPVEIVIYALLSEYSRTLIKKFKRFYLYLVVIEAWLVISICLRRD